MASSLQTQYSSSARKYIDLIDDLRSLGVERFTPIPQIAVMGDQSSGKSSVLESLSGVPFPRGTGLVTRCATEIRMKASSSAWRACVYLASCPDDKNVYHKADRVAAAITQLTDKLTNHQSHEFNAEDSIIIELSAPDVPDLTLIDLPGLIRTTTKRQSSQTIADVNSLISKYLVQEHTIILAVIPCNVDIATVDILEKAAVADPNGERTLGVLTKPDLIDEGDEERVLQVAENKEKPLKLGYIVVKNRSLRQLQSLTSREEAARDETHFFRSHPQFSKLRASSYGVESLGKRLTTVLVGRIKATFPAMKRATEGEMRRANEELRLLGNAPISGEDSQRTHFVTLVQNVFEELRGLVSGFTDETEIHVGADSADSPTLRNYIWKAFKAMQQEIAKDLRPQFESDAYMQQLKKSIREHKGGELPGFLKYELFEAIIRSVVASWKEPAMLCMLNIRHILQEASQEVIRKETERYPCLLEKLNQIHAENLDRLETECLASIENLVKAERKPFTLSSGLGDQMWGIRREHAEEEFNALLDSVSVSSAKNGAVQKAAVKQTFADWFRSKEKPVTQEDVEAEKLLSFLSSYWFLSSRRFVDVTCMTIDRCLVHPLAGSFQAEALSTLMKKENLGELFAEDEALVRERTEILEKISQLETALAVFQRQ